ncbi:MAG: hypothetical protein ACSHXK_05550 [Oceanococcus sp.]
MSIDKLEIKKGGAVWIADPNANWVTPFTVHDNLSGGGDHIEFKGAPKERGTGLVYAHVGGFRSQPAGFTYGIGKSRKIAVQHAKLICEQRHAETLAAFDELTVE